MHYRMIHLLVYLAVASLSYLTVTHLSDLDHVARGIDWWTKFAATQPDLAQGGIAVLVVSAIAGLLHSSANISSFIVEKLPFSRWLRRILSGRNFIEGDWPLIVIYGANSPSPGKLLYVGFLTVDFKDDQLYVYGEDWTPEGQHAVCFQSIRSSFEPNQHERRLQYFYRQGQTWQDESMRGYTEIYFFPRHKIADHHAGEFRDTEHNDVRFYAWKKSYRPFERRLKTPEEQKAAAAEVWKKLQPRVQAMIAQRVSADWM